MILFEKPNMNLIFLIKIMSTTMMCNVLDVLKQKTRNLTYVLFEVKTKYCEEIMGVLPQI